MSELWSEHEVNWEVECEVNMKWIVKWNVKWTWSETEQELMNNSFKITKMNKTFIKWNEHEVNWEVKCEVNMKWIVKWI